MKKFIGAFAFVMAFLITVQLPAHATAQTDKYLLINENQTELIEFMHENGIAIQKTYPELQIISAQLTDVEQKLIKQTFNNTIIQRDSEYKKEGEKDIPSSALINTARNTTSPYSGKGVKVGVLDSGIDVKHRDIKVKDGYCAIEVECAIGTPYDDDNGHGTHVAGIIAALANQTGLIGIAPSVDLYSIKSLNAFGIGTTTSLIDGIDLAIKNKIDILNLSITTDKDDPALRQALKRAYDSGILIVAAAGNNGDEASGVVMYPAKYDSVIAVSAVKADLTKLPRSASGKEVEIAAPGHKIFSTYPMKWDFEDGKADGYTQLTGTSMAAAHVTGVLALYKERFPNMTNVELRALLAHSAKDLGAKGRDDVFGHGLVEYKQALQNTISFTQNRQAGQLTLQYTGPKTVTVTGNGIIQTDKGQWTLYGVAGTIEARVTTKTEQGTNFTEKIYLSLQQPAFKDVNNTQRFAGPIGFLTNKQQIKGFPDGTLRPYEQITRAEAAAIIGRALGYTETTNKTSFKDVSPSSFAASYIAQLKEAKIISGFKDGTFKPDQKVTRGEMAIFIAQAFALQADTKNRFVDCHPSMAAYNAINALVAANVTTGYSDKTFKPNDYMSRADFAVFLARVQEDAFKQ